MRITDEEYKFLIEDNKRLKEENIELKAQRDQLRGALEDLESWFPTETPRPAYCIEAGKYGADDAINSARTVLEATKEPANG